MLIREHLPIYSSRYLADRRHFHYHLIRGQQYCFDQVQRIRYLAPRYCRKFAASQQLPRHYNVELRSFHDARKALYAFLMAQPLTVARSRANAVFMSWASARIRLLL